MAKSAIEWTESTWNPVTGCTKVSPGCKHCYAERMAERLQAMGQRNYRNGFRLTLQPHMLGLPLEWRRPQTIFVNSMSDLFHGGVPLEYVQRVFQVMRRAHWHRFQILTKRAKRLARVDTELKWAPHIWMGWVIVGGESGPRARPMNPEWASDLRAQCERAGVPFFFKQWGGRNKKRAGRVLEGRTWDQVRFNRFPSKAAFMAVARDPERLRAQRSHREPALADTYTMILRQFIDLLAESIPATGPEAKG